MNFLLQLPLYYRKMVIAQVQDFEKSRDHLEMILNLRRYHVFKFEPVLRTLRFMVNFQSHILCSEIFVF